MTGPTLPQAHQDRRHREDRIMAHTFTFTVTVEVEREHGRFASREDMAEAITEWLENADEGTIDGIGADGDSTYNTISWEVEEA